MTAIDATANKFAEYLNSRKVSFVDIGYGEYFIRNVDGVLEPYIKIPWSNSDMYIGNEKLVYNAVRLNNHYKNKMSNKEYDVYLQNTFVFIDYEEKVVKVNKEDCFK